jgi:hypothetical protein
MTDGQGGHPPASTRIHGGNTLAREFIEWLTGLENYNSRRSGATVIKHGGALGTQAIPATPLPFFPGSRAAIRRTMHPLPPVIGMGWGTPGNAHREYSNCYVTV